MSSTKGNVERHHLHQPNSPDFNSRVNSVRILIQPKRSSENDKRRHFTNGNPESKRRMRTNWHLCTWLTFDDRVSYFNPHINSTEYIETIQMLKCTLRLLKFRSNMFWLHDQTNVYFRATIFAQPGTQLRLIENLTLTTLENKKLLTVHRPVV